MKLVGSSKHNINKDKNCENLVYLENNEVVVLVYCNIINNEFQHDSESYIYLPQTNHFVSY